MSRKMTVIGLKGHGRGHGLMDWDEKTFEEMVSQLRANAQHNLDVAKTILAATDDQFEVKIVRGIHVQHFIREVKPEASS